MLLDVLGAASPVGHLDVDLAVVLTRVHFERDFIERGIDPSQKNRRQKKIGGDVILGEPANHLRGL